MRGRSACAALVVGAAAFLLPAIAPAAPKDRISLVVLVVIDQLGSETLHRYARHLDGGLAALIRRGTLYDNGVHEQANASTAPGHASIVTGAWPNVHGIVGNHWYDPAGGRKIRCSDDPVHGASPALLMAPTIADALRMATRGRSRSAVISMKERVSVIASGQRPTVSVWYDRDEGRFVGGKWYSSSPAPAWIERVSRTMGPRAVFGRTWSYLRRELDYPALAGPDDVPAEDDAAGLGRTFPHVYGKGLGGPGPEWFENYRATPAALDALVALAKEAIDANDLGGDDDTDLLVVGISPFDTAGHWWGPVSHEALDHLFRADRAVGELIAHVEKRIGGGKTLWVATADHGSTMTPEVAAAWGVRSTRPRTEEITAAVEAALAKLVKPGRPAAKVQYLDPPLVFLTYDDRDTDRLVLQRTAAAALAAHPSIADAFAPADLAKMREPFRTYYERIVYPGREPDVFIRPHPHVLIDSGGWTTGSGHGSPYRYDTHVPIIFAGPGVRRDADPRPYPITRIAPTIAALAGFDAPAAALEPPLPVAYP